MKAFSDNDTRLAWQRLLKEAVSQPGALHEAYRRFWNYSIGNQFSAFLQCKSRGIEPGPLATYVGWRKLDRYVRKGEQALTLCMPLRVKCRKWDDLMRSESSDGSDRPELNGTRTMFIYRTQWFVLAQT